MRSTGNNPLIAIGGLIGLALMIAAVWASGASTATSLALTAVLVLVAVAILAASRPRDGAPMPVESDAGQRERMRGEVP